MRRRRFALALVLAASLAPSLASAALLWDATWSQVGDLAGFPLTRTRAQLGAVGSSTATSIALNLAYPATSVKFFLPKTPNGTLNLAFTITQGGEQAITATPGMGGASGTIGGTSIVRTAVHANMGVNQSVFSVGIHTLVAVPLSVGRDGQVIRQFSIVDIPHAMTVDFYAWTPGTVVFEDLTSRYLPLPDVTAMGRFSLTPRGAGYVTLVSPSRIAIDGALARRRTASFTTLTLFFPEPGTWLLLGAGLVGVICFGSRRAR